MARLFIVFLLFIISVNAYTSFNEEKMTEYIKNLENQILTTTTRINKQQEEMATQNTKIAQQNTKFAELNTEIAQQNTKFAELNTEIAQQNTKFAKLNTNIANQETQIAKQNMAFAKINTRFAEAELNCSIDKNKLKPEEKQNQRETEPERNRTREKQNQRETCDCMTGIPINIALGKPAAQSSTYSDDTAHRAVDGNTMMSYGSKSCAVTGSNKPSWWCVDLLRDYNISTIKITNRDILEERLAGFNIRFSSTRRCDGDGFNSAKVCYKEPGVKKGLYVVKECIDGRQMSGRYVFIGGPGAYLTICEVEINN